MSGAEQNKFAAADSALGYLYQCRLALLSALRRVRTGEEFTLALETLDDVVFETAGNPPELLQTKHRRTRAANLTDASTDLWKTFRIWSEGLANGTIPLGASLYLATTSLAGEDSAARHLRVSGRDTSAALVRLRSTAQSSTNRSNQEAYRAFLSLKDEQQRLLIESVYVLDASPTIDELDSCLRAEVRFAVERQHLDSFLSRLEGWWLRRAIRHLLDRDKTGRVLSQEFEAQMDDLREQFKRESLPIDEDILAAEVNTAAYLDTIFVQQLRLIDIGAQRVLTAIREYYRAYEHRSRWLREDLLLVGELDRYERRLVEEWELVFERMKDDLGAPAAEEAKQQAARDVYKWVETTVFPIRPNVTEPFVTRGSYQILSDRLRIGWHPEFMDRLQHLLEERGAAT